MKKYIAPIIILFIAFSSCKEDKIDLFAVSKHKVGMLNDSTQVKEIKALFANDSIVNFKEDDSFVNGINTIDIYEKNGNQLLSITPNEALDSTSTISSIQLIDPRYKTEKGITSISTFKDVKDNYKISNISNLINSVMITVNEIDATFTIDKKELPTNMRFDMEMKIDPIQIPDNAKVKFFIVYF
ncbi:MAG: hypothetical protein ED556_13515 [Winogradskyella sp.]|uniref:hypothetical protein n=1 Tax=Winogradskyella sp. TaxID=1883156 RepID=UPI000F3BE29C|nr:hypothetical protein [Winogradskyella sp.]RNC83566.1 MAG: hypothetical protein ED556_13515 [Winogradskyella sp.]